MSGGGATAPPLRRVCFFGTYAREYTVTRLLAGACRAAGIDIVECHRPLWEETRHKDAAYFGLGSALRLLSRYARRARELARERRRLGSVAVYVVGFNGQLDSLWLRSLLWRERTPIVFAPLVTLTETLIEDRRVFREHSWRATAAHWVDRLSLSSATRIVIDTAAHRDYISRTFGIPLWRIAVWHLGADPAVFRPLPPPRREGPLRVLFYGSFLPLHGVQAVVQAAIALGDDRRVEFLLVGDGPERSACEAAVRKAKLSQVHFHDWVAYENLGQIVAAADICLGVFGASTKAQMVIPNKVYQAAAVGRPIITADTPAVREVFAHGETAWLCAPANAAALADAIRTLCNDDTLRGRLARQAAAMMAEEFSPLRQGQRLAAILAEAANQPDQR